MDEASIMVLYSVASSSHTFPDQAHMFDRLLHYMRAATNPRQPAMGILLALGVIDRRYLVSEGQHTRQR